jgi:hypothetical protein
LVEHDHIDIHATVCWSCAFTFNRCLFPWGINRFQGFGQIDAGVVQATLEDECIICHPLTGSQAGSMLQETHDDEHTMTEPGSRVEEEVKVLVGQMMAKISTQIRQKPQPVSAQDPRVHWMAICVAEL